MGILIIDGMPLTVNTTTYNSYLFDIENTWATQDRINNEPVLQNTGMKGKTITISGISLPSVNPVNLATLLALEVLVETAKPVFLIDSTGYNFGKWVLEKISQHNQDSTNYSINLRHYPQDSLYEKSKAYVGHLI
ncbi:phage tail protein [Francisella sp. SYW-9]|uniref:phage tail protein n=1 Tax=Francisella sp. SYW-9 TaxID=2610888 RepID=UPI00123E05E6|nr:phage tail protein [Francisella sp. SYW-9]